MVIAKVESNVKDVSKEIQRIADTQHCAYCFAEIVGEPERAIHRDGFGIGPEVPLCMVCGSTPTPTCEDIWAKIARK
ncbi:hypothetical protein UFOVP276_206 [uncultured Caudovirales phage]|uniref:Uncharacterized protein n=1 Tax=uncultured Caudovirales phage TaxID=2100421 RepID=A0A6J5LDK8_9CAUD|nr:hypothetical protein UFOVP127_100 [uncultured Caudovirales phage]CAB4135250.1 hypothetical protein UFOVP276_206 [uncultured Caudovirales phage]